MGELWKRNVNVLLNYSFDILAYSLKFFHYVIEEDTCGPERLYGMCYEWDWFYTKSNLSFLEAWIHEGQPLRHWFKVCSSRTFTVAPVVVLQSQGSSLAPFPALGMEPMGAIKASMLSDCQGVTAHLPPTWWEVLSLNIFLVITMRLTFKSCSDVLTQLVVGRGVVSLVLVTKALVQFEQELQLLFNLQVRFL